MFRFFIAVVVVFSFFRVTADVADGLIFHANFDAGLKAAYAAGNPEAQVQGAPADYLVPGLRGNGVLVNGGKTELSYETSGNLSSEAGTLSMFVYSYDFTLDDTFYHVFFDTFAEKSMFLLYKYFNQPNQIIFFCQSDLKVPNKHYNLRSPELDWPKGVWKHLAVTWTQSELCFYLDGKPLPPIKTEQTFLELGPRFYLGASVNRWGSLPQQPDTVIDEVRIYNRALAPEEIGELAAEFDLEKASRESVPRQGKTVLPRTEFQVPFTEQPPVIDGKIDPTEWRCATALSGLVSLEQKRMTEQQARFLLACDRDNLYVAMESPRESDLPLQGEKSASRDNGDLCMGDAYELFFEPGASGRDANVIQFMGNFLDDIFDRRGNDVSWNADVKVKNSVTDSMWSMEMAIPWRELGRNTPDENEIWGVNLARDFTGVAKWSSLEGSTYGEAGKLLKMRFGGDVSIQAPVLAGLETVQPEFRYRIVNHAASGRTLRIFNRIYTAEGRIVKQQEEEQFLLDGNSERFFTVGNRDMAGQLRSGDTYFHEFAVQSGRAGEYIYRGVTPFRYLEASAAADRKLSGEALKKAQAEFSAPWLGNQQGIDHSVPEPWTPVKFDNGRLEVWGRVYDFSAGILPGAIRSVDVDLFSGVPELILESGGSRCDLARLPFEVAERHPDVIVLKGEGQCGGLNAAVTVKVEFDGMLRCDLELVPLQGEARLERLSLTAGFPESNTEFVHYFLEKWQSAFAGKAPAGEIKLPFRRQFWIGNGDVGFAWFSPSAAHTTSGDRFIELSAAPGPRRLAINWIGEPLTLNGPVRYTFGLMATPVKPRATGWRVWQDLRTVDFPVAGTRSWLSLWRYENSFSTPIPGKPEFFHEYVKKQQDAGKLVLPYAAPNFMGKTLYDVDAVAAKDYSEDIYADGITDEYRLFYPEWTSLPQNDRGSHVSVCPNSAWSDFLVWCIAGMIERDGIDGMYFDNCFVNRCSNDLHGCGYLDENGVRRADYPIFAQRELKKRIYKLFKAQKKPTLIVDHISAILDAPLMSFGDVGFNGEHVLLGPEDDYFKFFDREKFQAEFTLNQWGSAPLLMSMFKTDLDKVQQVKLSAYRFLALTLLHDVSVDLLWFNHEVGAEYFRFFDRYRLAEAEFFPYWHHPVGVNRPDVEVSAYRSADRILLIAVNFAEEEQTVKLTPNPEILCPVTGETAVPDPFFGGSHPVEAGKIQVTIPGHHFRVVELKGNL